MSMKYKSYMNQFVLTICTCIHTSFDKKLHLNSYIPHEAHKNIKHEHAMNMINELACT